jgi:orotate phosphoribosyltransferase
MLEQFDQGFDLLGTMKGLDGYYECQNDADGKPLGPLVGYAGRYDAGGSEMKQYVGTAYFNFSVVERHPLELNSLAEAMADKFVAEHHMDVSCVLGMPMGGLSLALAFSMAYGCQYAFAEKKVTAFAKATSREESHLVLARHTLPKGGSIGIGEDVVNNFSTTAEAVKLVQEAGAEVSAIICAINRSGQTEWNGIPVISYVHRPTPQYRQDDPVVAELVEAGNVAWKPKNDWQRLMAAMNQ